MTKIEALTLEEAYQNAAFKLECSVTELKVEVIQNPSNGILGFFKKSAIIVATVDPELKVEKTEEKKPAPVADKKETPVQEKPKKVEEKVEVKAKKQTSKKQEQNKQKSNEHTVINDTIMPQSFVSMQDDEDDYSDVSSYLADYEEEDESKALSIEEIAENVKEEINQLFNLICFKIDKIEVSVYDETTLLIEFKGDDAALLIGKEGYRYKALSYMIFNWINTKYQVQLRLEIAEFLKNQEESVSRYLNTVCEGIDRDGRAQTKILDGVLVQIALKELRAMYPDKYVAIRSTRDGLKYIIVNDYHNN